MKKNYKEIVDKISDELTNHPDLNIWSFFISYSESLKVGLKDNNIGGLYRSPSAQIGQNLDLSLYWKDNTRSIHSFNGTFPEINKESISKFKEQAFYDKIIPDLPKKKEIKNVKVYDEAIEKIFKDTSYLFESISYAKENLIKSSSNLTGSTNVSISELYVRNSEGFNDNYSISNSNIFIEADNIYGVSESSRKLYSKDDVDFIIKDIKEYIPYYNKKAKKALFKNGKIEVIIPYSELTNLINFFILGNISAESIDINQSAFSIEDIKSEKKIMRDDFTFTIDNTKDYKSGSHKFSSVGNPAGRRDIIKNGKIKSPIIGLKYAKKFDIEPTPDILSEESLEIGNGKTIDVHEAYKNIKEGIIIDGVLGLHTQDHTSGLYSLNCQSSLFIKDGEIVGKGNVIINGNFFQDLLKDDFMFIKYPKKDSPGAKYTMDVTIID